MDTYFLGYDDIQREKMLYLNMLYDMIAYSINKGLRKLYLLEQHWKLKVLLVQTNSNVWVYRTYQSSS
jgi:hypothetical protein